MGIPPLSELNIVKVFSQRLREIIDEICYSKETQIITLYNKNKSNKLCKDVLKLMTSDCQLLLRNGKRRLVKNVTETYALEKA